MKMLTTRHFAIIAALVAASVTVSACAGTTQLPNLPQVQATTDKDVRASIAKAYQLIGAALDVIDHADKYEASINATGAVPASVHKAFGDQIVSAVKALDGVNTDIKSHALTTYAQIKARIDPVISTLNALLSVTKSGGFDWAGLLAAAVNLLMAITAPGVAGGVPLTA